MAEEDLTDRVRNFRRLGRGIPPNVVGSANLPDSASMRVRDGWVPDIALRELKGCGAYQGEKGGEDGEECEEATDGCEHG